MEATKAFRGELAKELLAARGWISCWLPTWGEADEFVSCRSEVLESSLASIDKVLCRLGHTGGGSVSE